MGYLKMNRGREKFEALEEDGHVTLRLTGGVAPIAVLDFELDPKQVEKLRAFLVESVA